MKSQFGELRLQKSVRSHPNLAARYTAAGTAVLVLLFLLLAPSNPSISTHHSLFLSVSSNETAARHLQALTRRPHVAGSEANAAVASYLIDILSSASIPARIVPYDVLLSYPVHRSLSLSPNLSAPAVAFDLVQEIYPDDPFADVAAEVLPSFHGYARSGTAAGHVVYANYGRVEDFDKLKASGVEVSGNVVLARYGIVYRGDIVRNAQIAGAVAAILYTDAKDNGGRSGKCFPDARWMPPSGVQVGSVYRGVGDPTTPGWASVRDCERVSVDEVVASGVMPAIPSLPVSSRDGDAILRTIGGQVAPEDWQGGKGAPVYRLGPGPGFVNLTYLFTFKYTLDYNKYSNFAWLSWQNAVPREELLADLALWMDKDLSIVFDNFRGRFLSRNLLDSSLFTEINGTRIVKSMQQ
ncbi:putative glutamate carboxypeptidase 2 [Platanthera guangdongensis]|uniref:Glutamate carboxypeptidase 2 n=1 Tax=Platanthera guangdongensis TaxID=2320717 RepID=A0ABR2M1D6_9ASPA